MSIPPDCHWSPFWLSSPTKSTPIFLASSLLLRLSPFMAFMTYVLPLYICGVNSWQPGSQLLTFANRHLSSLSSSFTWSRLFQSTIDPLYQTHLDRGTSRKFFLFLSIDTPCSFAFPSGPRICNGTKVICFGSLAWVQCEVTSYSCLSLLHEFHTYPSIWHLSRLFKHLQILLNQGCLKAMITLRVRYVLWTTFNPL